MYLRETQDLRRRTEIIPVKDSHTRIKPLALASGHGRYMLHNRYTRTGTFSVGGMAVTYSRYKFVTVSLPKRFLKPPCGGFRSETATWIQKYFKKAVGASRKL
jgi:hypothetical protein